MTSYARKILSGLLIILLLLSAPLLMGQQACPGLPSEGEGEGEGEPSEGEGEGEISTWQQTYGESDTTQRAFALVQSKDGGFALAGDGGSGMYLLRTDAQGNKLWSATFGESGADQAQALVQTGDGGFALAGNGGSDMYLVITDAEGNELSSRAFGGSDWDGAEALVQTSDGGFALVGGTSSYGAGETDMYLVRTDPNGERLLWSATFGGSGHEMGRALVQTSDGGFVLAGDTGNYRLSTVDLYLVRTDSNGNELWSKTYGGIDNDYALALVQTNDGGFALAGSTRSFGAGGRDVYLVKTDASGNELWSATFGGSGHEGADALVQTSDGGFALAGDDGSDSHLVRTDAIGNELWSETYDVGGIDECAALVQTSDGGFALAGWSSRYPGKYMYLMKVDAHGNAPSLEAR